MNAAQTEDSTPIFGLFVIENISNLLPGPVPPVLRSYHLVDYLHTDKD